MQEQGSSLLFSFFIAAGFFGLHRYIGGYFDALVSVAVHILE